MDFFIYKYINVWFTSKKFLRFYKAGQFLNEKQNQKKIWTTIQRNEMGTVVRYRKRMRNISAHNRIRSTIHFRNSEG